MQDRVFVITLTEQEAETLRAQCAALNAFETALTPLWPEAEPVGFTPAQVLEGLVKNRLEELAQRHRAMRARAKKEDNQCAM